MAPNPAPELCLSLLSVRQGDLSYISPGPRCNDRGRLFPEGVMDFLDSLAAICVQKPRGEAFFVSLATDPNSTTLYVSSNDRIPLLANYLRKIQGQLKQLHAVNPPIATKNEASSNPNNAQLHAECELELEKTIYTHTYSKLRRRFFKRAPAILKEYPLVMARLKTGGVTSEDSSVLVHLCQILQWMKELLQSERPPSDQNLTLLIRAINSMSADGRLKGKGEKDIVTRWDNLIPTIFDFDQTRKLSLRHFLEKIFALHNHIHTIKRVAWSRRRSPFLQGKFDVVLVPADHREMIIKFSQQDVLPVIFPENRERLDVQKMVYHKLLEPLKSRLNDENLVFRKRTLLHMDVNIHAECTLLAYHLKNPSSTPYRYFGGSKLSCRGCATLFKSFSLIAEKFSQPRFFTRGCHNKIHLRWACPFLLSKEQEIRSRGKGPTLDDQVRREMVDMLSTELGQSVEELCPVAKVASTPRLSDSTTSAWGLVPRVLPGRDG